MSTKAEEPPVKPIVSVPENKKAVAEDVVGDLFTVIDEKDIPALIRSGTYNVAKFWDDVKAHGGKALSINANLFMKRYYEGKEIPKHWNTNLQRRLQDFLNVKVVVRMVKGIPMIYMTVPLKLPEPESDKDDKDKDKDDKKDGKDKGKDKGKDGKK